MSDTPWGGVLWQRAACTRGWYVGGPSFAKFEVYETPYLQSLKCRKPYRSSFRIRDKFDGHLEIIM